MTDSALCAWHSGALDPGRALAVREEIDASPALRRRSDRVRGGIDLDTPPSWRLPPPGLGPWRITAEPVAVMGGPLRPGGRARARLPEVDPDRFVVVLRRDGDSWNVVFPTHSDELVRVGELPRDAGARCLDVTAGAGRQRWAVVFPIEAPDWTSADPWHAMQDAVTAGSVPAASFETRAALA